jgi:membrane protein DedA with SNARE-associated domain
MLGAVMHDTVLFYVVHQRADWVRSRPSYQKVANRVEALSKKAGYWQLALCRPLYGTRYPTLIFWGLQKLSLLRFWLADLTGLIPWALLLACLGYVFDDRLEALKHNVVLAQRLLLAALVLGITVWVFVSKMRKKTSDRTNSSHPGNPA